MNFLPYFPNALEPLPLALYFTAMVYALLGIYTLRRRTRGEIALYLTCLLLAMTWWSAGYGIEVHVPTQAAKVFWDHVEIPAIAFLPVFWLFFSLKFVGESVLLTTRNIVLASILPVLTVLAEWTNSFHHLYFSNVRLETIGNLTLFRTEFGPLFFIGLAYSYLLLAVGSILLLVQTFHLNSLFRVQTVTMLLAVLPPWVASAIYVFDLFPIPNLDITPFSFIPTEIILAWAIGRYKLLDVIPPTQNMILQELQDGVVLPDSSRRVVYMNRAVEEILSVTSDQSLGRPAEMVYRTWASIILPLLGREEIRTELVLNGPHSVRYLEVRITPNYLSEWQRRAKTPSYLLVFHNVTDRKQARDALKHREAILQAVSLASELFLKSAAWEKNIPKVLERLGEAAEVSGVYIFERQASENGAPLIKQRYDWVSAGIEPQIDRPDLQNPGWISAGLARWEEIFERHETISGLVSHFPESEKVLLAQRGVLSIVVIPIFVENKFWGFIGFDECNSERAWSEAELEALRAAADIFGAAITRGNIERHLLNRQRSQDLLQETLRVALGKGEIREVSRFLVDHLGILIGADQCFLALWDETREQTVPAAAYGVNHESYLSMEVYPGEKTLTASALEAGHTLVVDDARDSPYVSSRITELFGTRSVLVIPMISDEKKLGAVLLGFEGFHRFSPEEIMLCEQAADLVTLAIAKFQAVEEAHRRAEEAETLRRAGLAISETLNLEETTIRLLEQLAFVLPHESASVQLLRDGELEIVAGEGWSDISTIIGVRFPVPSDNPNTVVIETRKPYLLNEPADIYPVFHTTPHAAHIRSWLGVPLIVHNQIIGLLAIDSRTPNRFTRDDAELATAFAAQVAIAIENARLFNEVERLAITDSLTGLYNRRHFMKLAKVEFERACRYKRPLAAMIFDIDHFKQVNDTYGHPVGDQVLVAIARLCQDELREVDPIGRYGGEEFIVLIVEAEPSAARNAGERLCRKVEEMRIATDKGEVKATVSIGIAGISDLTPNLETLINRADQAMYVAKHKGRNRVVIGK